MGLQLEDQKSKQGHRFPLNATSMNIAKKSSRICIKNLPKILTLECLKDHFSRMGELTDAKLIRTREGTSRLAFIGYRTEDEANEAIRYFNHSYLKGSRIICEDAWELGNPNIPRPWSRYTKEKQKLTQKENFVSNDKTNTNKKSATKTDVIDDPKLLEFLHVMQPQSKSKFWMNDLVSPTQSNQNVPNKSVKEKNVKKSVTKTDTMHCESPCESPNLVCDKIVTGNVVDRDICDDSTNSSGVRYSLQDANDVLESARLYIHNLPYTSTEEEVEELFNQFGEVREVDFIIDKESKRFKGFGYVVYNTLEEATRALKNLDHTIFHGRILHVKPADPKEPSQNHLSEGKTYKEKNLEKRKALESEGHTQAWNSLFMRSDTIVENIARKYGISKSDLLDSEADNLAVRVALGETQIIADTKRALTNLGVNVASLEESSSKDVKRSNHVLLVKNLPFSSTESELSEIFGRFGNLDKIILPPTRTLALVIFLEQSEARLAFNSLRYSRYRDSMLYLEWAPSNIFDQALVRDKDLVTNIVTGHRENMKAVMDKQFEGIAEAEITSDGAESQTLYVTNLNFLTTDECLGKHIRETLKEGNILSIKIIKRQKKSKTLSSGYGFVEFDCVETANKACKALHGTVLDGHVLNFKHCQKTEKRVVEKAESDRSLTKLKVGNVAFEATEKDLRQLFSPFGQVKSVRLPKRPGGHRGFAFVEYVTKQEAQNALNALSSTHLYGRHLVLERAKLEESLDELRARTADQFVEDKHMIQTQMKSRKRRKISSLSD